MRICIIRHADPDYVSDSLTPDGHKQAQTLADHLQSLKIDEIYASPFGRTQLTAQYTADRLGLPVSSEPWLRELEGEWIKDLNQRSIQMAPPSRPVELTRPGAEPLRPLTDPCLEHDPLIRIREGSDAFLTRQGMRRQDNTYQVLHANQKVIAVFTHMGVGLVWLSHLLNIPLPTVWSGFFLYPASITTILMDERVSGYAVPRCIGLSDISHLQQAGLYPRPIGMLANVN